MVFHLHSNHSASRRNHDIRQGDIDPGRVAEDVHRQLDVWEHIEDLYELVFGALILTNDLYSFRREYFTGERTNVLHCLHINEGMPFQEPFSRVRLVGGALRLC